MTKAGQPISAGDGVVELQRFLHSQGYITKLQETPDGYTGALLQCCGCHAGHPIPFSLSFRLLDHPAWQLVRHLHGLSAAQDTGLVHMSVVAMIWPAVVTCSQVAGHAGTGLGGLEHWNCVCPESCLV